MLYKIEAFIGKYLGMALEYAEPHFLEIVICLVFATFLVGFFYTSK